MSDLVGNPEDRFCRGAAQILIFNIRAIPEMFRFTLGGHVLSTILPMVFNFHLTRLLLSFFFQNKFQSTWTRNKNKLNGSLIADKALDDVTALANFLITLLNFPSPDHTIALTK